MRSALAAACGALACAGPLAGCGSGDDTIAKLPVTADSGSDATTHDAAEADAAKEGGPPVDGGSPSGIFPSSVDVGPVGCGGAATQTLSVSNSGTAPLHIGASVEGAVFAVTPAMLTVAPGMSGAFTVTATVPASSTAGSVLTGAVTLLTDDASMGHRALSIPLRATATGATVVLQGNTSFPTTPLGKPATGIPFRLVNIGNAPASVTVSAPSNPEFSITGLPASGPAVIGANNGSLVLTGGFLPLAGAADGGAPPSTISATSTVSVAGANGGAICGPNSVNVSSIAWTGGIAYGSLSGWPALGTSVDFGKVPCDGSTPANQYIILTNNGAADVHVTSFSLTGNSGFTTDLQVPKVIPSNSSLTITLSAPAIPPYSAPSLAVAPATFAVTTDVPGFPPGPVTLNEEPTGAVLSFPPAGLAGFGPVVILEASSQSFSVTNTGNAPADVTLGTTVDQGGTSPFTVSNPTFSLGTNAQADSVIFSPVAAGTVTGALTMQATGPVCAPLPQGMKLSGFGIGGGPSVVPSSLNFNATCGGGAPPSQTFTVSNAGTANMVWALSGLTGPGKAGYTVSASPPPGTLQPGQSSIVTVTASAVGAPAASPSPSAYAASITVTTDVPFDAPHVVSFGTTPLGDQLAFSATSFRYGQIPVATQTVPQTFTIVNNANPGSPAANLTLAVTGSGAGAFTLVPNTVANLGPSGAKSGNLGVAFDPTSPVAYAAAVGVSTNDSLCTPLPTSIQVSGTGTQGQVAVSASTLAFGSDPSDPNGLVNCGSSGQPQTLTVRNTGNQAFNLTGLTLGRGAGSFYTLTGPGAALPVAVGIGQSTSLTIVPKGMPSQVANPNDPSPFLDTLTITTDAAMDAPHKVSLVMQARGAVIANTPLDTSWAFGTVAGGVIGTFASTITNNGNAPVSITFSGLQHPSVFGLETSPTIAAANAVTDVVGQFSPPQVNQQWTDQGTLVVTATQGLCEPLPASWSSPTIALSGASISGSLPVSVAGSLAFPSTNCGSAAPAAQTITLTNTTNTPYPFTASLASGAFYTLQNPAQGDAGAGIIPGNGVVVLGVTPQTVTPGPSAVAGAAPYADDLVIAIQSQPASGVTIPISWTLNGAMLSLPQGAGPNHDAQGGAFYAADTTSGLELPMANSGTATASVLFGLQAPSTFSFDPVPPIPVQPGILALPRIHAMSTDATCPSLTPGTATFLYSGPVCRPFPLTQVAIQSCSGTF